MEGTDDVSVEGMSDCGGSLGVNARCVDGGEQSTPDWKEERGVGG